MTSTSTTSTQRMTDMVLFKGKTHLRLKRIRAARAIFESDLGHQEIELTVLTDDGDKIVFQMPPQLAHRLVNEISNAYEAINPPLRRGGEYAVWDGMNDNG